MRIILASRSSLPNSVGGGEVHAHELARALNRSGHQASILTVEQEHKGAVTVRRGNFDGVPVDYLQMPTCRSIYDREPGLTSWAKAWLKHQNVDIVHLFLFNQLLGLIPAAKALRIPVCVTALEFSYFCRRYDLMYEGREQCRLDLRGATCEQCVLTSYSSHQRALAKAARFLPSQVEKRVRQVAAKTVGDRFPALGQRSITKQIERQRANFAEEVAAVITPSTVMNNFYLAQGVDASRLHLVPYGTSVQQTSSSHVSKQDHLRVGYIGRIDPKKGIDVLCDAVQMLPVELGVELKIFGALDGGSLEYADSIRAQANRDSRIKLLGKLTRDEVAQAYQEIDVLVVPSIWYENSPITISEALTHNCPVVCSDTAGMVDLVKHGKNGLTFPAGDKAALSDCLRRLIEEPNLLSNLRKHVRPVESTDQVSEQIVRIYERVRQDASTVLNQR